MQPQIRTFEQQVSSATIWRFFSPEDSVTVHLNMSEREAARDQCTAELRHRLPAWFLRESRRMGTADGRGC
jgi:translation initiation factor IF-3